MPKIQYINVANLQIVTVLNYRKESNLKNKIKSTAHIYKEVLIYMYFLKLSHCSIFSNIDINWKNVLCNIDFFRNTFHFRKLTSFNGQREFR